MFAVIGAGGRQHLVRPGSTIQLEGKDHSVGDPVSFPVLHWGGAGAAAGEVTGKVVSVGRGPKVYIQKFKRRKNVRRRTGFRASIYEVEITGLPGSDS